MHLNQRVVVVLGMHRSGTSLFARMLGALGVDLGSHLIPGREDNPAGFWEHAGIVAIHDEILGLLGRGWATPRDSLPYPPAWWRDPALNPLKARLLEILREELGHAVGVWGFKDPRICRLLPLWQEMFATLEIEPVYVLTIRHPLEVAASLQQRDGISSARGQLLWLEHNLEALRHTRGKLGLVLDYDRWFSHPKAQAEAALATLERAWPSDETELERVFATHIRPELRHQSRPDDQRYLPFVEETYALLQEAATTGKVPEDLWRIEADVRKAQTLLDTWAEAADALAKDALTSRAEAGNEAAARLRSIEEALARIREPRQIEGATLQQTAFAPLPAGTAGGRKLRIGIATSDIAGPIRNGGIGTAYGALAMALAGAGHEVTVLYLLGAYCEDDDIGHWVDVYAKKGIRLVPLPETAHLSLEAPWGLVKAYETYCWLKEHDFDLVHFPEWRGHGYFCMLAKRQGLAFADTTLAVTTHSPVLWHKLGNAEPLDRLEDLETDFMERESVALADVVVSPSRYMLQWAQEQRWQLPERCHVQQNILPQQARQPASQLARRSVIELVFFGRLEQRKGLILFCDALQQLTRLQVPEFKVTFLGKEGVVDGRKALNYLEERARTWTFSWQVVSHLDHAGAKRYLEEGPRLAVIPSLVENSPYTVLECLGAGIPFIASHVGGIPEMIHPEDLERTCFAAQPAALAQRLLTALREGVCPARAAVTPDETEQAWLAWHETLSPGQESKPAPTAGEAPLVSVCMAHFNRPHLLEQALASLEAQDYSRFEVIVVDDGSTLPEALAFLDAQEPRFAERGWRIVRQQNRYLGAVRNRAVLEASGEYVLFMDDDNYAKPHEISTLVHAARNSSADILTCLQDQFVGQWQPGAGQHPRARWIPLGGAGAVGAFRNCFGDANCLVRKSAFLAIGGFSEDYGIGHEDYEFFARAVLKGFRLEVVPEALFWYRVSEGSMLRSTQSHSNYMRSLRPYMDAVPDQLRDLVVYAQGLAHRTEAGTGVAPETQETLCRLAETYWNSGSWQMLAPLRNLVRRLRGQPPETKPAFETSAECLQSINAICQSSSWELMGPFRALKRLVTRRPGR